MNAKLLLISFSVLTLLFTLAVIMFGQSQTFAVKLSWKTNVSSYEALGYWNEPELEFEVVEFNSMGNDWLFHYQESTLYVFWKNETSWNYSGKHKIPLELDNGLSNYGTVTMNSLLIPEIGEIQIDEIKEKFTENWKVDVSNVETVSTTFPRQLSHTDCEMYRAVQIMDAAYGTQYPLPSQYSSRQDLYNGNAAFTFAKHKDGSCLVSFRGSGITDWQDWKSNIDTATVSFYSQEFHRGFVTEFQKLEPQLRNVLSDCSSVSFYGHSLGGALSDVATWVFRNEIVIQRVVTAGQPKVTKQYLNLGISKTRFVVQGDPVPCLPLGGYQHTAYGNAKICTSNWWGAKKCHYDQPQEQSQDFWNCFKIWNHMTSQYGSYACH